LFAVNRKFSDNRKNAQGAGPEGQFHATGAVRFFQGLQKGLGFFRSDRRRRPPQLVDAGLESFDVALPPEAGEADIQIAHDRSGSIAPSPEIPLARDPLEDLEGPLEVLLLPTAFVPIEICIGQRKRDGHERRVRRVFRIRLEIARDGGPVRAAVVAGEDVHHPELVVSHGSPALARSPVGTDREQRARREENEKSGRSRSTEALCLAILLSHG